MARTRILVLGASGRVGRLMRLAWQGSSRALVEILYQSRSGEGQNWQAGQANPFGTVDAVIALWGVTHGTEADLAMNVDLAVSAQKLAADCRAKRVLHCSSVAVYAPKDGLLSELDPVEPPNPYGEAKLRMEQALDEAEGPNATILRIGSVAGAESLANSIRAGWRKEASSLVLDQFADGRGPARSYIAPTDLARILMDLALHPADLPKVLNVGANAPVYMESLLLAAQHPFEWRPAPATARQQAVMDCSLLETLVGAGPLNADPQHIMDSWLGLEGRK